MRFNAPLMSRHRLNRYHRWMLLWLKWFTAFLKCARALAPFSNQAAVIAHQWLRQLEWVLVGIAIIRAAPRMRLVRMSRHLAHRATTTHARRAIVGSAMRRALRSRDLDQRIAALSQDIDALVARLIKRLPCGLTRRCPHPTRADPNRFPDATPANAGARSGIHDRNVALTDP
jgi:hypothetical protein